MNYSQYDTLLSETDDITSLWTSLLKTRLFNSGLTDISSKKEFDNAVVMDDDLLEGLSPQAVGIAYEYCVTRVDPARRRESGTYYTPADIAAVLANSALTFADDAIWCDPCVGSGALTIALAQAQDDPLDFLMNRMVCWDIDPLALLITRVLLVMEWSSEPELFDTLGARFQCRNFLDDNPARREYDHVIMNPPYVSNVRDPRFITDPCRDLYAFFMEKAIMTSTGIVSITPQSFMHSQRFQSLRELMINHLSDTDIISIDNVPDSVFRGVKFGSTNSNKANSVRAAITTARVDKNTSMNLHTTGLLRWRTKERDQALPQLGTQLTPSSYSADKFPKLGNGLETLYEEVKVLPTLSSVAMGGEWALYIPTTPRYYISALSYAPQRSSVRELRFADERSWSIAYILLNSSMAYWWWRVMDGGMTLSLSTLLSLPIPDIDIGNTSDGLINRLKNSESENVTYKMNSGQPQENVKHPLDLVHDLTLHVSPEYATFLAKTHDNSFITS